jgi:hypothetical protein
MSWIYPWFDPDGYIGADWDFVHRFHTHFTLLHQEGTPATQPIDSIHVATIKPKEGRNTS